MKGISPLIATILLIAFTVAVGGLISVWFSSLTSSQTQTVSASSEQLAKCASSSITILEARYPQTGTPRILNVSVTSSGTQTLKNVTISVTGGGGSTSTIKFFNATGDDFLPGQAFATSINTSGGAVLPPEIISVTGICQGQYAVSSSCRAGDPCMKPA